MTTTVAVKDELARARAAEPAARLAEVVTVLRFAGTVDREASAAGMRVVIEAELDSGAVARRLCGEIRGLFGIAAHESTPVGVLRRSRGCLVRVVGDGSELARRAGLTDGRGRWLRGLPPTVIGGDLGVVAAAWRGAFLARGVLGNGGGPALELLCPSPESAMAMVGLARRLGVRAVAREVGGADRVSIRDADAAVSLLGMIGAVQSGPAWARHRPHVRARVHGSRSAGFDDANQRRSADAAAQVSARVERALEILGDRVPENLRAAGRLRVDNSEVSLDELGRLADPVMTKDAVAGRIRRLLSMADQVARQEGIPTTEHALVGQ
ncbi:MAG: DNA-binding protein WhiA [Pseudonocardia sediminis]